MEKDIIEKYKKAGSVAARARVFACSLIKKDNSILEVTEKIEEFILKNKAGIAFPPQISLNHIAAHYCASYNDTTLFRENDLVKVDIGVEIDGFIGDTAQTIYLGEDKKIKELVIASKEAVENALKTVKEGVKVREIGKVIYESISERGFAPILNLSGHGLDRYDIHTKPTIPNFDNRDNTMLERDFVIAIEPFASTGAGIVTEGGNAEVFQLKLKKPTRNIYTREILKEIENYKGLPFAKRWLLKKFPLLKVNLAFKELIQLGCLNEYPPLPDKAKGIVSQHEHTCIVTETGCIVTTRED